MRKTKTDFEGLGRAACGAQIIRGLAARLEVEYGSGFGVRQLDQNRKFYRLYPIAHTLCAQLNWSQYKLLIPIEDADKREYYQLEAVSNCWTKGSTANCRALFTVSSIWQTGCKHGEPAFVESVRYYGKLRATRDCTVRRKRINIFFWMWYNSPVFLQAGRYYNASLSYAYV